MINWAYIADATSSTVFKTMRSQHAVDGRYSHYCYKEPNCPSHSTLQEENPWTRIVWGIERSVWRIKFVATHKPYMENLRNIQIIVFGNTPNVNRVVCTTIPSSGNLGLEYAVWCDHEIVGKGAELIFPPGIANSGEMNQIRLLEIQILGYGWRVFEQNNWLRTVKHIFLKYFIKSDTMPMNLFSLFLSCYTL